MYQAYEYIKDKNVDREDERQDGTDTLILSFGPVDLYVSGFSKSLPWDWWIDQIEIPVLEWERTIDFPVHEWEAKHPGLVDCIYAARDEAYGKESVWLKVWTKLTSFASRPSLKSRGRVGSRQDP